jgi:hypothetical protein
MYLAEYPERCEVVAAFTNPTLHRIISQHFYRAGQRKLSLSCGRFFHFQ